MWNVIGNFADIGTAVMLIIQIKGALSKPGRVKKLIAILLIVSLCLTPVFSYLGESIDVGIGIKFFVAIVIGVSIGIFRLNSYFSEYSNFTIETKVRIAGDADKTWKNTVTAKIGDTVEFQLQYRNLSSESHSDVSVRDILPKGLEYVNGSTILYNKLYPNGLKVDQNDVVKGGIIIGKYAGKTATAVGANAFVRFSAKVVDESLACGANVLINWGQVQAGATTKTVMQDNATVNVVKVCDNKEPDPTPTPDPEPTPELPFTGPESIAGGARGE